MLGRRAGRYLPWIHEKVVRKSPGSLVRSEPLFTSLASLCFKHHDALDLVDTRHRRAEFYRIAPYSFGPSVAPESPGAACDAHKPCVCLTVTQSHLRSARLDSSCLMMPSPPSREPLSTLQTSREHRIRQITTYHHRLRGRAVQCRDSARYQRYEIVCLASITCVNEQMSSTTTPAKPIAPFRQAKCHHFKRLYRPFVAKVPAN